VIITSVFLVIAIILVVVTTHYTKVKNMNLSTDSQCGVYLDPNDKTIAMTPQEIMAHPQGYFPEDFVWGTATSSYQIEGEA